MRDITVDHLVRLALLCQLAGSLDSSFGAVLLKISKRHDFTTNDLKIRSKSAVDSCFACWNASVHLFSKSVLLEKNEVSQRTILCGSFGLTE